jgi:hypothetical protein
MDYSERALVMEKITGVLRAAGFTTGSANDGSRPPLLPKRPGVVVSPSYSPENGSHYIVVYPEKIDAYVHPYPTNYSNPRIIRSETYHTPEELVTKLRTFVDPPIGCWGEK